MTATIWCRKCDERMPVGPTGYPTCPKCRAVRTPPVLNIPMPCGSQQCCRVFGLSEKDTEKRTGCQKCKPFAYCI